MARMGRYASGLPETQQKVNPTFVQIRAFVALKTKKAQISLSFLRSGRDSNPRPHA